MSAIIEVVFPDDQPDTTSGRVGRWLKAAGDTVVEHEPLLEVETEKVTLEVPSPASGVLRDVLVEAGSMVDVGQVIARIATSAGLEATAGRSTTAAVPDKPPADAIPSHEPATSLSPGVRRRLADAGLSSDDLPALAGGNSWSIAALESWLQQRAAGARGKTPAASAEDGPSGSRQVLSPMRRAIAEHMQRSLASAPHVTSVFEVDLGAVLAHQRAFRTAHPGTRRTLTAYFVRAMVEAVRLVPEANARFWPDAVEIFDEVHIGIAVALEDRGLIVPVLRHAERLDLQQTATAIDELVSRARNDLLSASELRGGTISLSNHGVSGSLIATPIVINQPQSAIVGIGKVQRRPSVVTLPDGAESLAIRSLAYVTLTIDHRVMDGFAANRFLTRWVQCIEEWPAEPA